MSNLCPICKKPLNRCKCTAQDLGVKIGSKEEAAWRDIKEKILSDIGAAKRGMIINQKILEVAEEQMRIEAENFKNKNSDL